MEVPELLERIGRGERVDQFRTVHLRKDGARAPGIAQFVAPLCRPSQTMRVLPQSQRVRYCATALTGW